MSLLSSILGGGGKFEAPPNSFEQSFSSVDASDGAQMFRLMSKANKYSSATSSRKQKKGGEYAAMAGQLMKKHGVNDPKYSSYTQAYEKKDDYGMNDSMLGDFMSGKRKEDRTNRRKQHGRYESRPQDHNQGQGRKQTKEEGGMFDFFDSDTSSSSSDSD